MAKKVSLIIAAGGMGTRFRKKSSSVSKRSLSKQPQTKLFHLLAGQPVLFHSIQAFDDVSDIGEVILAVPKAAQISVRKMTQGISRHPLRVVAGGKTRSESVLNGIKNCRLKNSLIMVHDGARPLIKAQSIKKLIRTVLKADGAILASPITSTVKEVKKTGKIIRRTLNREGLYTAETPQIAQRKVLLQAYREQADLGNTDEAGLLEAIGAKIKIVTHDDWNPKITTVEDLKLAEAYVQQQKPQIVKVGLGQDLHQLVKGRKLYLAGLHVPYNKGALGHSDGDVVLHSVIDAMLGVMGAGDIGDWFSDKDKRFKNIRSPKMLGSVLQEAAKQHWVLEHTDVVITLEKPKLGSLKIKMKKNLAKLLNVSPENVSIKAKTAEGLGAEGQGQAISCLALVTMKKG